MFTIQAKTTAQGDSKLSVIMNNKSRKCPLLVEIARLAVVGEIFFDFHCFFVAAHHYYYSF